MTSKKKNYLVLTPLQEVQDFFDRLSHPLKPVLEAVRECIVEAAPKVVEEIKWNSPSFKVKELFATINIRDGQVMLVLHLGEKVKDNSTKGIKIRDTKGLLTWVARERALVSFKGLDEIKKNKKALQVIIRQWIQKMA
ncbi:MAG: DUF1801 domain-containing protein [Gemmataceae bacterium]|nr:DUF1801 domain-containing protein [Gemmataceae bacterium]